jgi:hypothetical protein
MNSKFRILSKIESRYRPVYEGVFLILDNSPSAASMTDFRRRKIPAAMKKPFRMQKIANKPLIPKRKVT